MLPQSAESALHIRVPVTGTTNGRLILSGSVGVRVYVVWRPGNGVENWVHWLRLHEHPWSFEPSASCYKRSGSWEGGLDTAFHWRVLFAHRL